MTTDEFARSAAPVVRLNITREVREDGYWSLWHHRTGAQLVTKLGIRCDEFGREIARRFVEANPRLYGSYMYMAEVDFTPDELERLGFNTHSIGWMLCAPAMELETQWSAARAWRNQYQ